MSEAFCRMASASKALISRTTGAFSSSSSRSEEGFTDSAKAVRSAESKPAAIEPESGAEDSYSARRRSLNSAASTTLWASSPCVWRCSSASANQGVALVWNTSSPWVSISSCCLAKPKEMRRLGADSLTALPPRRPVPPAKAQAAALTRRESSRSRPDFESRVVRDERVRSPPSSPDPSWAHP